MKGKDHCTYFCGAGSGMETNRNSALVSLEMTRPAYCSAHAFPPEYTTHQSLPRENGPGDGDPSGTEGSERVTALGVRAGCALHRAPPGGRVASPHGQSSQGTWGSASVPGVQLACSTYSSLRTRPRYLLLANLNVLNPGISQTIPTRSPIHSAP